MLHFILQSSHLNKIQRHSDCGEKDGLMPRSYFHVLKLSCNRHALICLINGVGYGYIVVVTGSDEAETE